MRAHSPKTDARVRGKRRPPSRCPWCIASVEKERLDVYRCIRCHRVMLIKRLKA